MVSSKSRQILKIHKITPNWKQDHQKFYTIMLNIQVNGKKILKLDKVREFKLGLMAQYTKDGGMKTKQMAKVA